MGPWGFGQVYTDSVLVLRSCMVPVRSQKGYGNLDWVIFRFRRFLSHFWVLGAKSHERNSAPNGRKSPPKTANGRKLKKT